jgi:ATP-dependent RNA helicase RhlE
VKRQGRLFLAIVREKLYLTAMENADTSWNSLGLTPEMLIEIEKAGYKNPSQVQSQAIPHILEGHDVLASSQTGSGKTASFVIPIVEKFKNKNGTYILALSPTREIAQQTGAVFEAFGAPFGMKVAVCIGGAPISVEKEALSSSPHIIVATPGRLCDHLERGHVWLDFIQCLIFDEADRMLEMGFAKQIDTITEQIPKARQTLMFSATFSTAVEKLARAAMNKPKEVVIAKSETSTPKIEQRLYWTPEDRKLRELIRILKQDSGTMFVFVNAKERAYQVWRLLHNAGFESATYIHSDLPQEAREQAVADFKAGKFRVIIATDVMGRGIDVDDVSHVVNYDVPREPEDYVHRIGRTGRRGLTGHASTFAIPGKDDRYIKAIEKMRGVPAPEYKESESRRPAHSDTRGGRPSRDNKSQRGPRPEGERNARLPQGQGQPSRGPRPERPPRAEQAPRATQPVKAPEAVVVPPVKKGGFLDKIKSLFKR